MKNHEKWFFDSSNNWPDLRGLKHLDEVMESVTLDTYRNPRPPRHMKVWGTTRNLADGMIPMGWILCRAMNGVPHGQQGTGTGSGKKTASGKGKRSKPPMGPAGKKAGPPDLSALQKRFRVTKGNRKKSGK